MAGQKAKRVKNSNMVEAVADLFSPKETKEKTPRTMLLNHLNFERLQRICRDRGVKPAHLVDRWIENFLNEIKEK